MLAQLICMDRRYQRMNCFNIREIQTLLRARFYADLVNESSHHLFLAHTALGLRLKLNNSSFINLNNLLLHRYGIVQNTNVRVQEYLTGYLLEPTGVGYFNKYYLLLVNDLTCGNKSLSCLPINLFNFTSPILLHWINSYFILPQNAISFILHLYSLLTKVLLNLLFLPVYLLDFNRSF